LQIIKTLPIFAGVKKTNYPYRNTDLRTLPGEKWKDIPGLDGLYQVSSLGRIKRLERTSRLKNKVLYPRAEKIIKPELRSSYNAFKNDYTDYLSVRVAVHNVRYNFSIQRLVFTTFREGYKYEDRSFVVTAMDGDTLNAKLSNLRGISISEKQQRIKDLGRSPNPFHKLSAKHTSRSYNTA
jgi:hypothetical protein